MRTLSRSLACAVGVAAVFATLAPALAVRPGCQEMLAARYAGKSVEQVAETFGTTSARVQACERFEEQRQRLADRRSDFYWDRALRGLDQ